MIDRYENITGFSGFLGGKVWMAEPVMKKASSVAAKRQEA
jgi:hypothetical protein